MTTRETLWKQINELAAVRATCYRRFDLWESEGIIKNGAYFAYLFDSTHNWDTLTSVAGMQRVSRKRRIAFAVAYDMLAANYARFNAHLCERMLASMEPQR